ncbi:hypothetical protein FRC03_001962 [Tulasnella sp. 419]|nr:hypothetical protein FRC03_001962 [Tulasnella sp. 419]
MDEPNALLSMQEAGPKRYTNQKGLSRKHIFESVKHSLERLQLDYLHRLASIFDYDTPIEETMQALHDVVKAGYVRYIGMSSCYAWQFQKMQYYALSHGLTPFNSMQNFHNAVYREEEREFMLLLKDLGVGCIPWSPLAHNNAVSTRSKTDPWPSVNGDPKVDTFLGTINQRVKEIAEKRGISMAQVALAWSLSKDFISAPIISTTKLENSDDLVAGIHIKLTEEEIKYIDEPYRPRAITGHW